MRGRAQRGLIAKLESRQLEIGRAVVRHNLGAGDFRRFARGEATARGGEERAVALIGAQRSEALGFQDRVRAVRLPSESVERHPRYAAFETEDGQRVQRILDRGEWIEQRSLAIVFSGSMRTASPGPQWSSSPRTARFTSSRIEGPAGETSGSGRERYPGLRLPSLSTFADA